MSGPTRLGPGSAGQPPFRLPRSGYNRRLFRGVALDTLVDDFSSQRTDLWTGYNGVDLLATGGQVSFTPTTSYNALRSLVAFDLTESSITFQITQPIIGGNGGQAWYFQLCADPTVDTERIEFSLSGNPPFLDASIYSHGNVQNILAFGAYSVVNQNWLRIRETGQSILWETSPDSVTWTTFAEIPTSSFGYSISALKVRIGSGYFGTEPTIQALLLDKLNTGSTTTTTSSGNTATAASSATNASSIEQVIGSATASSTASSTSVIEQVVGSATAAAVASASAIIQATGSATAASTATNTAVVVQAPGTATAAATTTGIGSAGAVAATGTATGAAVATSSTVTQIVAASMATAAATAIAGATTQTVGMSTAAGTATATGSITRAPASATAASTATNAAITIIATGTATAVSTATAAVSIGTSGSATASSTASSTSVIEQVAGSSATASSVATGQSTGNNTGTATGAASATSTGVIIRVTGSATATSTATAGSVTGSQGTSTAVSTASSTSVRTITTGTATAASVATGAVITTTTGTGTATAAATATGIGASVSPTALYQVIDPAHLPSVFEQYPRHFGRRAHGVGSHLWVHTGAVTTVRGLLVYRPSVTYPTGRVVATSRAGDMVAWDASIVQVIPNPATYRMKSDSWQAAVLAANGYPLVEATT